MQEHVPVLLAEALEALQIKAGGVYVDGTVGCAGHAQKIFEQLVVVGQGRLVCVDRDAQVLALAEQCLKACLEKHGDAGMVTVACVHANYGNVVEVLKGMGITAIDGLLLDLGVSSLQLDRAERGFSFQKEAPLDMRMDTTRGQTAADVVNSLPEEELADVIFQYGEERHSRKIARFIVQARQKALFHTTTELAAVVSRAYHKWSPIHPATRTFQALRIYVNDELVYLQKALDSIVSILNPGGRLCVMSYHSLEDRLVKHSFRNWAQEGRVTLITKKPIVASDEEVQENRRARSAKLRVCEGRHECIA